jgi:peptide/nickel transport system permease protein
MLDDMTSHRSKMLRRFFRRKLAVTGAILVLFILGVALLGPFLVSYDPVKMNIRGALQESSAEHLLGTDHRGRDTLTRLAYGAGISLKVGFFATSIALILGVSLGAISGYLGGLADSSVMRAMDALMAFPGILLALALVSVLQPGIPSLVIAIGVVSVPRFSRISRAAVLQKKSLDYVQAAKALGKPRWSILTSDILPNCLSPIIVQATLTLPSAILGEASLSFLGLGTPPPAPSWGRMLNEARGFMEINPELAIYPGVAIFLTVLGFNLLGDGLRDVLDPRQS